ALNRSWHLEHFVCCCCRETIEQNIFFEKSGKIYCEKDYHSVFSPKCNKCLLPIFDMCVMALDKTWHLDHFTCDLCQKMLVDEEGFHEFNNNIYCRLDGVNKIAPRCFTCQQPIMDNFLSAMNKQWHIHCFVCLDCKRPISAESVYEHDGQPYCFEHYHKRRLCRCHTCHEAIFGAFVAVGCKKFHPDHFVCSFCRVRLSLGGFKIREGKYYCVACFNRLVG
ncbi:hypothetical protein HELRODRAFT_83772, partial [Helobdella robusta]|uniref:LIM zinc-binding domain-containing protein n=1 Tax=Helobdella robusta TaxID=6412 RepID=T1G5A0_HELRO